MSNAVPPTPHSVTPGPQTKNETDPVGAGGSDPPETSTVALSVRLLPIGTVAVETCVVSLAPQTAKLPRTKSFSVAVVDVDERVSDATVEKHSFPRPSSDRLTPPS